MTPYTRAVGWLWRRVLSPAQILWLRAYDVECESGVTFLGTPLIERIDASRIQIGQGSVLCSRSEYTALGVNHPVVLRTLAAGAKIEIGRDVGISGCTICAAIGVVVGDGSLLGANVIVADTDFHPVSARDRHEAPLSAARAAPVVLGRNVFVGANSVILKGVSIGENAVIGAGSIVTRDIPANCVAVGNPARPLGGV